MCPNRSILEEREQVHLELFNALLQDPRILRHLAEEDSPFHPREEEAGQGLGISDEIELPLLPGDLEPLFDLFPPLIEDASQALPEAVVEVGELEGQIPHRAPADAPVLSLDLDDPIQVLEELEQGVAAFSEDGGEDSLAMRLGHPVQNGVAQLLFALEVVVKIAFPNIAFAEDIIQGCLVETLQRD
jgi:hypothetical protein